MKKYLFLILLFTLLIFSTVFTKSVSAWDKSNPLIIDHNAVGNYLDFIDDSDFQSYIDQAKNLRIYYAHTSHGGQITNGIYHLPHGFPNTYTEGGNDLGFTGWVSQTENALGSTLDPNYDVVIWAWCHQVCTRYGTGSNIQNLYLNEMNQLESDYPDVTFIYMTGFQTPEVYTKDMGSFGTCTGSNLHSGNDLIRDHINTSSNKVLYDFADIESCNPEGGCIPTTDPDIEHCGWCNDYCTTTTGYTCPTSCHSCDNPYHNCEYCTHQQYSDNYGCLNCQMKGMAFWTMMAEIAGWSSGVGPQPDCTDNIDCDDQNPCTTDVCNVDTCEYNTVTCGSNASCNSSSGDCECISSEFSNCDGDWNDGCEVDLSSDIDNCGSCGNACGSSETCESGSCVSICIPGDTNNDTIVDENDAKHVLQGYLSTASRCEDQNGDSILNVLDFGKAIALFLEDPKEPPSGVNWVDITTTVSSQDLDASNISHPTSFFIGNRASGTSDYAGGIIDEFKVYGPSGDLIWYSPLENEQATVGPDASNGGCDFVEAKYGNGARFDSPLENLNFPITQRDTYDYSDGSIEFWYKPFHDSSDVESYMLWSAYGDTSNRCYGAKVYIEGDQSYIYFACNQGGTWIIAKADSTQFTWNAGDWVHLQFKWDDSVTTKNQQRIHIDRGDGTPEADCGDGDINPGEECDPPGDTQQCSFGACMKNCTCPTDSGTSSIPWGGFYVPDSEMIAGTYGMSGSVRVRTTSDNVIDSPEEILEVAAEADQGNYSVVITLGNVNECTYPSACTDSSTLGPISDTFYNCTRDHFKDMVTFTQSQITLLQSYINHKSLIALRIYDEIHDEPACKSESKNLIHCELRAGIISPLTESMNVIRVGTDAHPGFGDLIYDLRDHMESQGIDLSNLAIGSTSDPSYMVHVANRVNALRSVNGKAALPDKSIFSYTGASYPLKHGGYADLIDDYHRCERDEIAGSEVLYIMGNTTIQSDATEYQFFENFIAMCQSRENDFNVSWQWPDSVRDITYPGLQKRLIDLADGGISDGTNTIYLSDLQTACGS